MWISLLISILGSDTIKLLVKRGFNELRTRVGTSIDPELAEAVISDIASSNGNKLTVDIAKTAISALKEE